MVDTKHGGMLTKEQPDLSCASSNLVIALRVKMMELVSSLHASTIATAATRLNHTACTDVIVYLATHPTTAVKTLTSVPLHHVQTELLVMISTTVSAVIAFQASQAYTVTTTSTNAHQIRVKITDHVSTKWMVSCVVVMAPGTLEYCVKRKSTSVNRTRVKMEARASMGSMLLNVIALEVATEVICVKDGHLVSSQVQKSSRFHLAFYVLVQHF